MRSLRCHPAKSLHVEIYLLSISFSTPLAVLFSEYDFTTLFTGLAILARFRSFPTYFQISTLFCVFVLFVTSFFSFFFAISPSYLHFSFFFFSAAFRALQSFYSRNILVSTPFTLAASTNLEVPIFFARISAFLTFLPKKLFA